MLAVSAGLFLLIIPSVSAKFTADSLTKGELSVWCIFDIVYLAIALACLIPIVRLKSHRAPYFALFATTLFSVIQCSVEIGYITTARDDGPQMTVAFNSIIVFFANWSSPLLYLAIWLLLADRYKQWQNHNANTSGALAINKLLFNFLLGLFAVLMLLSTISSALYVRQLQLRARLILLDRVTMKDVQRARSATRTYLNANYVFLSFWFFSAVCVAALSGYVYRSAKRIRTEDHTTKVTLFVITPLYISGVIQSIVFTVYFSPSVTLTSQEELEELTLASDLISNFIYACISVVVLALGLKSEYWRVPDQIVALTNLGAIPAGRYLELGEPRPQK